MHGSRRENDCCIKWMGLDSMGKVSKLICFPNLAYLSHRQSASRPFSWHPISLGFNRHATPGFPLPITCHPFYIHQTSSLLPPSTHSTQTKSTPRSEDSQLDLQFLHPILTFLSLRFQLGNLLLIIPDVDLQLLPSSRQSEMEESFSHFVQNWFIFVGKF